MQTRFKQTAFVAALVMSTSLVGVGVWTQLGSGASTPGPDKIVYSQQNGKNGTYIQYVPGDGTKATTQAVTGGGGCATPNTTNPVLAFSAHYYPNGYANAPVNNAIVGAFNQRTGVCQIPQAWSIEVNEGLVFAPGSNSLTAGRVFARAQLQLQREDKSAATDPPVNGVLVEKLGSVTVGTTPFSINGPDGTTITADTGAPGTAFDSIEIQVLNPATGSVSVVGPTSTFTLASKICVGGQISTASADNQVQATATYVSNSLDPSACKSYTDFSAEDSTTKRVNFPTTATPGARLTVHIDWGTTAFCTPSTCAPSTVDFNDGNGPQNQTFCAQANPPATPAWCTTKQTFSYETDPVTHLTVTHIVEDWSGFGDPYFARR